MVAARAFSLAMSNSEIVQPMAPRLASAWVGGQSMRGNGEVPLWKEPATVMDASITP